MSFPQRGKQNLGASGAKATSAAPTLGPRCSTFFQEDPSLFIGTIGMAQGELISLGVL